MSLMEVLPKSVTNKIIVVYTNCESVDMISFQHDSLNDALDLQKNVEIPYVCVENPLATNHYLNLIYNN